jgi:hypothetical protein
MMLGKFYLSMKVFACHIEPNYMKNISIFKDPYPCIPYWYQEMDVESFLKIPKWYWIKMIPM